DGIRDGHVTGVQTCALPILQHFAGEVYELWDQDLDRRLACKVLHPEIAWTPGMLVRFRQEAKALARLQHSAILPIHFTGDAEGRSEERREGKRVVWGGRRKR